MICPLRTEQSDLLLEYAAGRLDAVKKALFDQHVETCRECAAFRAEQSAVWEALDLWEPAPVSVDFNRKLWRRIDAAAASPWYRKLAETLRFANWKPVIPLTAAMAVMAAGFLLDHRDAKTAQTGFTVNEANQVEQTLDDIQLLRQLDAMPPSDGNPKRM